MHEAQADSAEPGRTAGPELLADYYAILAIKHGFTDWQLLVCFLRSSKRAMACGDHAALMDIRRGFEVLRYEDTRIAYFRMHRVFLRHEGLRFPDAKKYAMLHDIRTKEALALQGTSPVVGKGMDHGSLLFSVISGIMMMDLARLFTWGGSGVALLVALPIIIAVNGLTWPTAGICALISAWACLALKARASDYVTYPPKFFFRI